MKKMMLLAAFLLAVVGFGATGCSNDGCCDRGNECNSCR
jgi:hypothetical protein